MVNVQRTRNDPPSNRMMETLLTFTIGQEVESKSHAQGYRGAWFRCKIEDIDRGGRGQLRFKLRYLNFPDEALHWSQAYQQRQRGNAATFELMLRPPMPAVISEQDLPDVMFDGLLVVARPWGVGDLVNFWCDDVWWECFVSEIIDRETVKVSLFKPPHGEGGQHSAKRSALRPSLVWTLADGWSVPALKKNSHGTQCARLVRLSSRLPKVLDSPLKREKGTYLGDTVDLCSYPSAGNIIYQWPGTLKLEDQSLRNQNPGEIRMTVKQVPDFSALRSVVQPLDYTDDEDSGKEADSNINDSEAILKRLSAMKMEKYREQVRKNVKLARFLTTSKRKLMKTRRIRFSGTGLCRSYLRHRSKIVTVEGCFAKHADGK